MYHQASHEKPTFGFNYKKKQTRVVVHSQSPSQNDFFYILQNRYYSACFSYISESIILKSEMYNVKSAKYDKNKRKCVNKNSDY